MAPVTFDRDPDDPGSLRDFYTGARNAPWRDNEQNFLDDPLNAVRVDLLLNELQSAAPRALLDVGCGAGALLEMFSQKNPEAFSVGCDLLPGRDHASNNSPHPVFAAADAAALPFAADTFDCAVCTETLEHLADPAAALAELGRVLAPGGALLATVPNLFCWDAIEGRTHLFQKLGALLHKTGVTSRFQYGINTHLHKMGPRAWRRLLEQAGFSVEREQPVYTLPYIPYFLGPAKAAERALMRGARARRAVARLDRTLTSPALGQLHFFVCRRGQLRD